VPLIERGAERAQVDQEELPVVAISTDSRVFA
jgi:hypothetical protein